jgi:hypothetical protein
VARPAQERRTLAPPAHEPAAAAAGKPNEADPRKREPEDRRP